MSFLAFALSPLTLFACAIVGYALMMWTNPARDDFRDGLRALRRYSALWLIPGAFACCAALFQLAQRTYLAWAAPVPNEPAFFWVNGDFWWLPREDFLRALLESRLPAFETLAGVFNCLVATFPISAVAAFLLLVNRGGHQGVLVRALHKRFGVAGWAVHLGILGCALAAIAKPFLYVAPQILGLSPAAADSFLQWSRVVVSLSFLFEYLCGLFVQIYLILLAYAWVRGITFTPAKLVDVALRRFSFVVKWAGIVMLLSVLFIELPIILRAFAPFAGWFPDQEAFARRLSIVRGLLAVFALVASTMQITLVFHSESLTAALRDHRDYLKKHWWRFSWFVIVAALHCFALHALQRCIATGLGAGTAAWVLWALVFPWIAGAVLGWLLASWVCVYKRGVTPAQSAATQTMFRF